jgi:hypothetical protein
MQGIDSDQSGKAKKPQMCIQKIADNQPLGKFADESETSDYKSWQKVA